MKEQKEINVGNGEKQFMLLCKSYNPATQMSEFMFDCETEIRAREPSIINIILNNLNNRMLPFHYSVCIKCGTLSLHSAIFAPNESPESAKLKKVLDLILDDIEFWIPRIIEIASEEDDPLKLYTICLDQYYNQKDAKYNSKNIERRAENE